MTERGPEFADIKRELLARIESLARELAPGGNVKGSYYMPVNPTRNDRRPGSFWIRVRGTGLGAWRDESTGDQGDVIKLVHYCLGHADMKETRAWCLAWLGWSGGKAPKLSKERRAALLRADEERRKNDAAVLARERAKNAKKAFGWWLSAEKEILLTPVDTYLRSRGIQLTSFKRLPGAIRYLAKAEHTDEDTGELTEWPAMFAAMSDPRGKVAAVHRTFLMPNGQGKAPVTPDKKIWPTYTGCMIRIAKGDGNLTPEKAAGQPAPLLVTEGIEDALSFALAKPDLRVWAAGTLGNLAHVPPLRCISRLIVAADNDTGNPQAQASFDKSMAALRDRFGDVRVVRSFAGKDANDLLQA